MTFWNLRATGRDVWFVPAKAYVQHAAMVASVVRSGRYAVNPHVENSADLQKGPSIPEDQFREVLDWVQSLDVGPIAGRNWQPRRAAGPR